MHSPHDLYIPEGSSGNQVAHMLWTLGYKTVAMVTQVTLPPDETVHSKRSKPEIPSPGKKIEWTDGLTVPRPDNPPKQLSRLHVVAEGLNHLHCLSAATTRHFDLVSVEPRNEKVWQSLTQSSHLSSLYDIVSWDSTQKLPFHLKRSTLRVLHSRGVKLEIRYAGGLSGSSCLRNLISSSLELTRLSSSPEQLILSSGANSPLECRSPSDLSNLATLFGVASHLCHFLTNQNAASLLRRAAVRTSSYKGVVSGSQLISEEERNALLRLEQADTLATEEFEESINSTELRQAKKRSSIISQKEIKKQKSETNNSY